MPMKPARTGNVFEQTITYDCEFRIEFQHSVSQKPIRDWHQSDLISFDQMIDINPISSDLI
jgi:hypothetical protein